MLMMSLFPFTMFLQAQETGDGIDYVTKETYVERAKAELVDPLLNEEGISSAAPRFSSAYYLLTANGKQFYNGLNQPIYGDNAKFVLDLSEHNSVVDFEKVKAFGVDAVILRAGYGYGYYDKQFDRNIKECNRLGIPYGIYLYSYAYDANFAYLEASSLINQLKKYDLSYLRLPIYYDLEDFASWNDYGVIRKHPETVSAYNSIVKTFVEAFESAGYHNVVNVYSYRAKLYTHLNSSYIHSLTSWAAEYGSTLNFQNKYYSGPSGWQYASTGRIDGISGPVDLNVFSDFIFNAHKLAFNNAKESIHVGQSKQLSYTSYHPLGNKVSFTSSNSSICSVDSKGKITANKTGTVTITMKDQHQNCIATTTVQVLTELTPDMSDDVFFKQLSVSSIQLNFTPAANAKYYDVYRATSKYGKYYKMTRTDQTTYTNTGLTPCRKYYYRVRSVNGTKTSALTKPILVQTKLQAPQFKLSSSQGKVKVEITASKGAHYYQLYCRRPSQSSYKKLKTLNSKNLTFLHNNKTKGVSKYNVCCYRIYNGTKYYSPFSKIQKFSIS